MNVFEIDAASNNSVDDIRRIKEEVEYPPVEGRFKVYIIDEVHMLSTSAFQCAFKDPGGAAGLCHIHTGHHGSSEGACHHTEQMPAL